MFFLTGATGVAIIKEITDGWRKFKNVETAERLDDCFFGKGKEQYWPNALAVLFCKFSEVNGQQLIKALPLKWHCPKKEPVRPIDRIDCIKIG